MATPYWKGSSGTGDYTVQKGDNLTTIAKKYGTTVDAIARANGIKDVNRIGAGAKLTIPGPSRAPRGSKQASVPTPRPRPQREAEGVPTPRPRPKGGTAFKAETSSGTDVLSGDRRGMASSRNVKDTISTVQEQIDAATKKKHR